MKHQKIPFLLLSAALLFSCNKANPGKPFYYAQGTQSDYQNRVYYSDDYFRGDSTTYNDSLATASLCFAMSSFASTRNSSGSDYSKRYRNVESFLKNAGFRDFIVNDYFKKKPEADSLGAVFANKKIDETTLIAIGIRGANYEMEWASNFTLGTNEKYHQGFYDASEILLNGLKDYIINQSIHGQIKIWISGYSRAGATCNLSSGRLDDSIKNKNPILPSQVVLKKENLYSYCFEPPRGVIESGFRNDIHYNNIYNIINFNDVVPLVAMEDFGFSRYGTDMYLTDALFDSHYFSNIEAVKDMLSDMENYGALGATYYIDDFKYQNNNKSIVNYRQGLYLRELLNLMTSYIGNKSNYVSEIQNGLRNIMSFIYRAGVPKGSLLEFGFSMISELLDNNLTTILIDDLLHSPQYFFKDFMPVLMNSFKQIGIEMNENELHSSLENLIDALIFAFKNDIYLMLTLINKNNISSVASGHYPELCLSHLMARDKNYTDSPVSYDMLGEYYIIQGNRDISISVMNGSELLAKFDNETCSVINDITYGLDYTHNFICYLPYNENYQIVSNQEIQIFHCCLSQKKTSEIFPKKEYQGNSIEYSIIENS